MLKKIKLNSSGFSLVEILVTVGIFSISIFVGISFLLQMNQNLKQQSAAENRLRIFQNLIYIMGMPSTLRGSLENDTSAGLLWRSIRDGLGAVPAAPIPISLFLPVVAGDATTVVTSGQISGPPAAPLLYSPDGGNCNPTASVPCDPTIFSISVSTEFLPICPPVYDYYNGVWVGPVYPSGLAIPTNCNRAQYIKVIYRFQPTVGAPAGLSFAPVTGSIMVSAVLANVGI